PERARPKLAEPERAGARTDDAQPGQRSLDNVLNQLAFHLVPVGEPREQLTRFGVTHVPAVVVAIRPLEVSLEALDSGDDGGNRNPLARRALCEIIQDGRARKAWVIAPTGLFDLQRRYEA